MGSASIFVATQVSVGQIGVSGAGLQAGSVGLDLLEGIHVVVVDRVTNQEFSLFMVDIQYQVDCLLQLRHRKSDLHGQWALVNLLNFRSVKSIVVDRSQLFVRHRFSDKFVKILLQFDEVVVSVIEVLLRILLLEVFTVKLLELHRAI